MFKPMKAFNKKNQKQTENIMATKFEGVKSEKPNWKCKSCTFLNKNNENFCEVCNTNRNGTPSQQLHQSQKYDYQAKTLVDKSQAEKEIPVDNKCFLCGKDDDATHCKYCNKKSFCEDCRKKYHNHPNRQWHLQLETKNAATKTVDAEFIPIDNILAQLSDKASEHQTKSNDIIDETEKYLTNCHAKLNQQLETINESKLEASSKNKKLYLEYEEKRFEKAKISLRQKFDEFKKAEWLAIGEDMKIKYQKEFNTKWLEKQTELEKTSTNKSEIKMQKLLSKHHKELEQQTAFSFEQRIIGMRAVWESNLKKELEEYLINCRQKLGKKTKKKWKIKNKNIMTSFSDEAIDKEIDKVYREALDKINNILVDYKLKQRENLNDLKENFQMQDMLFDQVEALKRKITTSKSEISQLNQTVSELRIKIGNETCKSAKFQQQLDQKTIELQKHEKLFRDNERQLKESVKYIETIKAKAEIEWDKERKKLGKEKEDLHKSLSTWRIKYYEEQKEYLQTIETFNSNECKLSKELEKMQKLMREKEDLINELSKFNEEINFMKIDFENKKRNYEEEVLKWQNICRAQYTTRHHPTQIAPLQVAPFRPNFDEAFEPRDSAEDHISIKSKQLDILEINEVKNDFKTIEKPFESANLQSDLKSPTTTTSKMLTGSENVSQPSYNRSINRPMQIVATKLPTGSPVNSIQKNSKQRDSILNANELKDEFNSQEKSLEYINLKQDLKSRTTTTSKMMTINEDMSKMYRSTNNPMRTDTSELPTGSLPNINPNQLKEIDENLNKFINEGTQLKTSVLKPEPNLHMIKRSFDTTNKDVSKGYSNYNRETSNSNKPPIIGFTGSFTSTSDPATEPSDSIENKISNRLKLLNDSKQIETSKDLKNYIKFSKEKFEQKLQMTAQSVGQYPKNLNESVNQTQIFLKKNNAQENWNDDKFHKEYAAVHTNKKSSDDNIQPKKFKNSITKEEVSVSQETKGPINAIADLPAVNQSDIKKLPSSDLVGVELTKQTKEKKSNKKKHSTSRDCKTGHDQLKLKSPDESRQKDSNDTSSGEEHFESAEEGSHQSE